MDLIATALAVGLTDISLSVMIVGAIVLAGATVVMTAIPDWRLPRWRRRSRRAAEPVQPVAVQRRVVTGRAPILPPPGAPLPGQRRHAPDGPGSKVAPVDRAEAMIDHFLDTDPEILAATMSAWIAQDDRKRRGRRLG